jgi:hypothetical protein
MVRSRPGFLASLGDVLDAPGRGLRSVIAGRSGATGRDVLSELGVIPRVNPAGLDPGDVAGFAAEVGLDPLMLLGGVGGLTKAGKASKRISDLLEQAKFLQATRKGAAAAARPEFTTRVQDLGQQMRRLIQGLPEGAQPLLARGMEAQARTAIPQRRALSFGLPFIGPEFGPRGAAALGLLGRGGAALGRTRPVQALGRAFKPRFGVEGRALKGFELAKQGRRGAAIAGLRLSDQLKKQLAGRVSEAERPLLGDIREAVGIPERQTQRIAQLEGQRVTALKREAETAHAKRLAKNQVQVEKARGKLQERVDKMAAASEEAYRRGDSKAFRRARSLERQRAVITRAGLEREDRLLEAPLTRGEVAALENKQAAITARNQAGQAKLREVRAEAEGLLSQNPRLTQVAIELRKITDDILEREIAEGLGTTELHAQTKAYMERILTREARVWINADPKRKERFFKSLHGRARKYSLRHGSMQRREESLLEIFTSQANEFFEKENAKLSGSWFEMDPVKSVSARLVRGEDRIHVAQMMKGLIHDLSGTPHREGKTMPLAEFLHRGPLYKLGEVDLPGSVDGIEKVLKELGMGGRGIPNATAEEALGMWNKISGPDEVMKGLQAADAATSLLRYSVTIPWPGFAIRNILSDAFLSWIGGGANPRLIVPAIKETFAMLRGQARELYEKYQLHGAFEGSAFEELTKDFVPGRQPSIIAGAIEKTPKGVQRGFKKAKNTAEFATHFGQTFSRVWHFKSMEAKGLSPFEAGQSVRRHLLDYSDITDTEREVFRRLIFFWQWPSKVIPRLMSSYFEDPRRMALLTRLTTQPTQQPDTPIPEFLRTSAAIPAGTGPSGEPRFIQGLGSPLEELTKLDFTSPEGGLGGAALTAARRIGTNLNPLLRLPAELAAKRSFFFDQPILERDRAEAILEKIPGLRDVLDISQETFPGGGVRVRGDPLSLFFLRQPPLGRAVRTANELFNVVTGADPRASRGASLAKAIGGFRIANLNERDLALAARRQLEAEAQKLIRSGEIRQAPGILFAPGEEGEKSEKALELLEKRKDLQKLLEVLREKAASR